MVVVVVVVVVQGHKSLRRGCNPRAGDHGGRAQRARVPLSNVGRAWRPLSQYVQRDVRYRFRGRRRRSVLTITGSSETRTGRVFSVPNKTSGNRKGIRKDGGNKMNLNS